MKDWTDYFVSQGVVRARLQDELTMHQWGDALVTARENALLAVELGAWLEQRVKNGEAPS